MSYPQGVDGLETPLGIIILGQIRDSLGTQGRVLEKLDTHMGEVREKMAAQEGANLSAKVTELETRLRASEGKLDRLQGILIPVAMLVSPLIAALIAYIVTQAFK